MGRVCYWWVDDKIHVGKDLWTEKQKGRGVSDMAMFLKNLSIRIKILEPVSVMGIMMLLIGFMGIRGMGLVMHQSTMISDNILPDYEKFVESGRQYNDDAARVGEAVTMFSSMAESLQERMEAVTEAVGGIATNMDGSAKSVTSAAESTSGLVGDISEISVAMDENRKVAGALKGEADRFINLDQ